MPLLRAALWFVLYWQPSEFLTLNLPNLPALPSCSRAPSACTKGRTWKFPSAEGRGVTAQWPQGSGVPKAGWGGSIPALSRAALQPFPRIPLPGSRRLQPTTQHSSGLCSEAQNKDRSSRGAVQSALAQYSMTAMPALPVPPVWASGIHPLDTVQRRERDGDLSPKHKQNRSTLENSRSSAMLVLSRGEEIHQRVLQP